MGLIDETILYDGEGLGKDDCIHVLDFGWEKVKVHYDGANHEYTFPYRGRVYLVEIDRRGECDEDMLWDVTHEDEYVVTNQHSLHEAVEATLTLVRIELGEKRQAIAAKKAWATRRHRAKLEKLKETISARTSADWNF
jgi:hypothetical protein